MATYQMHVKVDRVWQHTATIQAADDSQAFKKAMLAVVPEHYALPIRIERDGTPVKLVKPLRTRMGKSA